MLIKFHKHIYYENNLACLSFFQAFGLTYLPGYLIYPGNILYGAFVSNTLPL